MIMNDRKRLLQKRIFENFAKNNKDWKKANWFKEAKTGKYNLDNVLHSWSCV